MKIANAPRVRFIVLKLFAKLTYYLLYKIQLAEVGSCSKLLLVKTEKSSTGNDM